MKKNILITIIMFCLCSCIQTAEEYYKTGFEKIQPEIEDYKGALLDFNKAIELNPNYADAYCKRGNTFFFINNFTFFNNRNCIISL